ncbi:MAG: TetR/AcrR family transcriptional regulator, partial [Spirochaetaceae bacterium]|nr:TetR/AcrR family transcriptional regulator [Spirochaetaceae bacterium]
MIQQIQNLPKVAGHMVHKPSAKQDTRENIKHMFLSLYKKRPLSQIFVSDLVKACDISRGTFYFYFNDIIDLYRECEQDIIDEMESSLNDVILSTVGTNYEQFVNTYAKHLNDLKGNIEIYHILLNGSERASFRKTWFESVRRNYQHSMTFSSVTAPAKRNNLAIFFAGGIIAVLSEWVLNDCKEPEEDIAAIVARITFQGAFPPPP